MALQLSEYRVKLINKILFAATEEEVRNYINAAMVVMEQNKISSGTVSRFIEQIVGDLELFDPMKKQAQQWSNIKVAKILFIRISKNVQTKNN